MGPEGLPASKTRGCDENLHVFENLDEFEKFLENITYKKGCKKQTWPKMSKQKRNKKFYKQ